MTSEVITGIFHDITLLVITGNHRRPRKRELVPS